MEAIGRLGWIRLILYNQCSEEQPLHTSSLDLFKVCQYVHMVWVLQLSGWSTQVAYHAKNQHSWLRSTLWMSHGQAGIVAIKLSLLKGKFTGAYDSTDQLQTASTAATEARVPGPSAVLGLQYLKNSVRGQRHRGDVLTWKKCTDWRSCLTYCWSAVVSSTVPLFKPINPPIAFLICGPVFEVLPPPKK